MIDPQVLPLFLGAVVALLVVPGPDMLLISMQSVGRGARHGIACAVGVMLAGLLQTALVAFGLGRVMETWPLVATAVRIAGAVYLGWLGLKLLREWARSARAADDRAAGPDAAATPVPPMRARRLVLVGLLNNLLNPKALLFFGLFLPQFVSPALGQAPLQLASLGLLLTLLAFAFNVALALAFASLRALDLRSPTLQRHSGGVLGLLFLALASRLALAKSA